MNIFSSGWSVDKDGPGQRYVVYLKGCNMCCRWCASPESISAQPQILFYPERSDSPVDYVCPYGAVKRAEIDREQCHTCNTYECVKKWKHKCFELSGYYINSTELSAEVLANAPMFGDDGGVTFGGGEPSLQVEEILSVLNVLRPQSIHTAMESNASTPGFRKLVGKINLIIADLKCITAEKHREWTGIDNSDILANLELAAREQADLLIRIPLVKGFNTDDEEVSKICDFLEKMHDWRVSVDVEILRMHHIGQPKYAALGMDYPVEGLTEPEVVVADKIKERLNKSGINVI